MNNDYITPGQRTGRGPRPGNAWIRADLLRDSPSLPRWLRRNGDAVVVAVSMLCVVVWLALDDIWLF